MKRDWIKLDVGILDDPAYGTLTDNLWRLMILLNLLAGEVDRDGLLPAARDMAWELRMGTGTLQISLHHLCERGLVQSTPQGWLVTGFKESQAAPNSTERSRAFRKRRMVATQDEQDGNDAVIDSARCALKDSAQWDAQDSILPATRYRALGASEMQLSCHVPVSKPVPNPVSDPRQRDQAARRRRRHKPKGQPVDTHPVDKPVDKPVENPVDTCPVAGFPQEKGRKISDSTPDTSSTSSLIKSLNTSLNTSLNIKLPLLELVERPELKIESEKFRPSQGKTMENSLDKQDNASLAAAQQPEVEPERVNPEILRETVDTHPVNTHPVDKPVENPVDTCPVDGFPQEKGRKFSDPDEHPPRKG